MLNGKQIHVGEIVELKGTEDVIWNDFKKVPEVKKKKGGDVNVKGLESKSRNNKG